MYKSTISITTDQRYYHMIILKSTKVIETSKITKRFGDWRFVKTNEVLSTDIVHYIYNSEIPIHRGNQEIYQIENNIDKSSITGKRKAFAYDCMVINFKADGIICLLAPFAELIETLQSEFITKFLNDYEFLSIKIYDVIKTILDNELVSDNLTVKTTGVGISKFSAGDISNINIKGNKPLSTDIGELVFGLLSSSDSDIDTQWIPSICRFKCVIGREDNLSRINLSLNTDRYGNYKMYLQKLCLNILSLIYFINYLKKADFFASITISPTKRKTNEVL